VLFKFWIVKFQHIKSDSKKVGNFFTNFSQFTWKCSRTTLCNTSPNLNLAGHPKSILCYVNINTPKNVLALKYSLIANMAKTFFVGNLNKNLSRLVKISSLSNLDRRVIFSIWPSYPSQKCISALKLSILMTDSKKLQKFGKIKFVTAKVHKRNYQLTFSARFGNHASSASLFYLIKIKLLISATLSLLHPLLLKHFPFPLCCVSFVCKNCVFI